MKKYHVGTREVHVNTVEVSIPDDTNVEEIKRLAAEISVENSVILEYSHNLNPEGWTIEEVVT